MLRCAILVPERKQAARGTSQDCSTRRTGRKSRGPPRRRPVRKLSPLLRSWKEKAEPTSLADQVPTASPHPSQIQARRRKAQQVPFMLGKYSYCCK